MPLVNGMDAQSAQIGSSRPSPTGRPARWVGLFIAGYLLIQVLLPLRYYFGKSADERFAWRMFSYEGMHRCKPSAWEVVEQDGRRTVKRLELGAMLFSLRLEQKRPEVVAKFMRWRCEQPGVVQVRVMFRCTTPGGERLDPTVYWMDRGDSVVRQGEAAP